MNDYQQFIFKRTYARFIEEEQRRETWEECVDRYVHFWVERYRDNKKVSKELGPWLHKIKQSIMQMGTMPSMRCLQTAGPALTQHNVAGYNCGYTPIDHIKRFSEILYILMCGTGVGFSVQRHYIGCLPEVPDNLYPTDTTIVVRDSKLGWAKAYKELISLLYSGHVPNWDTSRVRPRGSRLATFGGRASGPEPLVDLFKYTCNVFRRAVGRRLTSLEVHDIVCKIAEVVVVGGVRRSALISLSDYDDERMAMAKTGKWWEEHPHRALANNSLVYNDKPELITFMKEWVSLYESRSGERGIFSSRAANKHLAENVKRRELREDWGTNPCSEIILRPQQFCNLSEVVVRSDDTVESLRERIRIATVMGTLQSVLTDFKFLSAEWRRNCEEERLLGVSLTGIMDNPLTYDYSFVEGNVTHYNRLDALLETLKNDAIETNKYMAEVLDIPESTAITCVKPSGTVSQLVNSSSGIHPRFSKHYIRRVRVDRTDPLAFFLEDQGLKSEPDVMSTKDVVIFSFPEKAPEGAMVTEDIHAIDQLQLWSKYAKHYCEHKPSITCYYRDSDFLDVGAWVFRELDTISGIAFLPHSDHIYAQAPYEAITEEQYNILVEQMPKIKWEQFHEEEDTRDRVGELACTSDKCEITYV